MSRKRPKFTDEELQEVIDGLEKPPGHEPVRTHTGRGWHPDLNYTQNLIFHDSNRFIFAYAEKASGKTYGFGHKAVRHAYENRNALVQIISPSIRTGADGIWHDIDESILPQWKEGMGLEYMEAKIQSETKDRIRWIGNRFDGWSMMKLISIPYGAAVQARVKGPAPSFVYIDELDTCDSEDYFTYTSAQVGRRRNIDGPQQWTASANPKGPSHWVYKTFWVHCIDPKTGERNPRFSVYHVPIQENLHRLPPGYYEDLMATIHDPVERKRLLEGLWVDRPSGEAIFKDYFYQEMHVRGDVIQGSGLTPKAGYPIVISYDPGARNFSVTFLQMLPTQGQPTWIVFDEVNCVGERTPYHIVVSRVLNKMEKWNEFAKTKFTYEHIADEAAFSHKDAQGSFDAREIESISQGKIRMRPCPKGKGSVEARVRMLMNMLLNNQLYVSAMCPKTIEMFGSLISEKTKPGEWDPSAGFKPSRSTHLHSFDSLTYGMFYFYATGLSPSIRTQRIEPMVFSCGHGLALPTMSI